MSEHARGINASRLRQPRGRPISVDRMTVAESALSLWQRHGFEKVTWREIASAAGISQRTILRHFSSKEDLAWVAVPYATERLQDSLDAASQQTPTGAALAEAVRESLQALTEHLESGPAWVQLISSEPALRASASIAYQPWIGAIAAFISERHPELPGATARGIAAAYQSTAFDALLEWVDADPAQSDPIPGVLNALRWLSFSFASDPTPLPEQPGGST